MSVVFMEQDADHYFFDSERQLDENQSIRVEKGAPVYFRIECADEVIDKIYPTTTGDREGELEKHQADDAIEILRVSADSDEQVLFLAEDKKSITVKKPTGVNVYFKVPQGARLNKVSCVYYELRETDGENGELTYEKVRVEEEMTVWSDAYETELLNGKAGTNAAGTKTYTYMIPKEKLLQDTEITINTKKKETYFVVKKVQSDGTEIEKLPISNKQYAVQEDSSYVFSMQYSNEPVKLTDIQIGRRYEQSCSVAIRAGDPTKADFKTKSGYPVRNRDRIKVTVTGEIVENGETREIKNNITFKCSDRSKKDVGCSSQ